MNWLRKFLADRHDPERKAEKRYQALVHAQRLHSAAIRGNIEWAQELIRERVNVNAGDQDGFTPLMRAAMNNQVEIMRFLIEHRANVNARHCESGGTALMCACVFSEDRYFEPIHCLLDNGAKINAEDTYHETVLIHTAEQGYPQTVRLLLECGAKLTNRSGEPALVWAAVRDHLDVVAILLDAGTDINSKTRSGQTALMCAAGVGNKDLVCLFLERGADVRARDRDNQTALSRALAEEHTEIVEILRQAGA